MGRGGGGRLGGSGLVLGVLMETAGMALNAVDSACVECRLGLEVVSQWAE